MELQFTNENNFTDLKYEIAAGNQNAFRQLFDSYSKPLAQFAFSIVQTKDAALDVVDEVFIRMWKNKENIIAIENIRVYLYTAVKNAALNYLSHISRQQINEPFDYLNIQLVEEHRPDQQMITEELFKKIHAAVEELPPRCKMIFKLVREDGLKYKEVAEILNLSVNTVDAQMVIAVKRIVEKVKTHFDFLPRRFSNKI